MGLMRIRQKSFLVIFLIFLSVFQIAYAQVEITPIALEVKVYSDGSTLVTYSVESDPTKVRVGVEIFGDNFSNLIIRDEDEIPLDSEPSETGITIDTIGASELTIVYSTYDLTTKDGPIWDLNLTSPVSTTVILPKGAAIFDMGSIPLDLGTINGAQYILLPAGEVYVSFLLFIPNLSAEAQTAIAEAESYIDRLESQTFILTDARGELTQAQQFFSSNLFVDAKNRANQAVETADLTVVKAQAAATEIALAQTIIVQAQADGRTVGLSQAQNTLASAETYYGQGLYLQAETVAKQASQLALTAAKPSSGNSLIYLFFFLVIAAAGGYYYMQNMRREDTPKLASNSPESEGKIVNLEKVFEENEELRLEDREVIKFLAGSNGEAFATEIRTRFDLPRSSAWRLIRRLVSLEIVEEVKIGNQSLVRIKEKYFQ